MRGTRAAQRAAHQTVTNASCWQESLRSGPQTRQQAAASEPRMQSTYKPASAAARLPDPGKRTHPAHPSCNKSRKDVGDRKACAPRFRAGPYDQATSAQAALKQRAAVQGTELLQSRKLQEQHAVSEAPSKQHVTVFETKLQKHYNPQEELAVTMASEAGLRQCVEPDSMSNIKLQEQLAVVLESEATLNQHVSSLEPQLLDHHKLQEQLAAVSASEAALRQRVEAELMKNHKLQEQVAAVTASKAALREHVYCLQSQLLNNQQQHQEQLAVVLASEAALKQRVESQLQNNHKMQKQLTAATASKAALREHVYCLQSQLLNNQQQHQEQLAAVSASEAALRQRVEAELMKNHKLQEQLAAVTASEAALREHVYCLQSQLLNNQQQHQEQLASSKASEAALKQRVESELQNNHKLQEQLAAVTASEVDLIEQVYSLQSEVLNNQQQHDEQLADVMASEAALKQRVEAELQNNHQLQEQLAAAMAANAALRDRVAHLEPQIQPVFNKQQEQGMQYCQQETLADTAMEFDDPSCSSCNTTQAHTNSVANDMPMETMRPAKRQRLEPPGQPSMSAFRIPDLPDSCITNIASHLEGSSLLAFMATSCNMAKLTMDSLSMANKPLMTFKLSLNSRVEGFGQVMSWAHHIRLELEHVDCQLTMNTAANCGSQYQARGVQEIRLRDESMLPALGNLAAFCPNAHALDVCFAVGDKHLEAIFNMPGLHKLRVHGINSLENDYSQRKVALKQLKIHNQTVEFATFANLPLSGLSGPIEWTSPTSMQVVLLPDAFSPSRSTMERAADNLQSIEGFSHAPIKCGQSFLHFITPLTEVLKTLDPNLNPDDYTPTELNAYTFEQSILRQQDSIARNCWPSHELKECHRVYQAARLQACVLVTKDSIAGPHAVNNSDIITCFPSEADYWVADVTGSYHRIKAELGCA